MVKDILDLLDDIFFMENHGASAMNLKSLHQASVCLVGRTTFASGQGKIASGP